MSFKNNKIKFLRSKRGISPLIATVLLIAFAVALGAVVMNWGRSYIEATQSQVQEQGQTEIKCSTQVKLQAAKIGDVTKVCYDDSASPPHVKFIIENTGTVPVSGLKVQIINDGDNINTTSINGITLTSGDSYSTTVDYTGNFQQVRIVPVIQVGLSNVTCANAALTYDTTSVHQCP